MDIKLEEHEVVLMDENKTHKIVVWFLGYTIDRVKNFVSEKYKDHTRWVKFKILK